MQPSTAIRPAIKGFLLAAIMLVATATPGGSAEAPYEKKLVRLAEVLGSLHYLRNLCGEPGSKWREQMQSILDAENPEEARRATLVASFNRGYRSFDGVYSTCTISATTAIARYMKEGEGLSREIVSRYGD